MTKKERLYREWISLRNQLKDQSFIDVEKMCDRYKYNEYKVYQLERNIEMAQLALKEQKRKEEAESFFSTERGQFILKSLDTERETALQHYKDEYKKFEDWFVNEICRLVGTRFIAKVRSYNLVEIGLINTDPEREGFDFQFGHDFEIRYDGYSWGSEKPSIRANYGSLGTFDLLTDNDDRQHYLWGMATILNDRNFLKILLAKFIQLDAERKNFDEISRQIDKKKENPTKYFE